MSTMCTIGGTDVVISLEQRLAMRGIQVELTEDERIHKHVARELGDSVSNTKLCQAQARAVNLFHSNLPMTEAIRCAVAWARYSLALSPDVA